MKARLGGGYDVVVANIVADVIAALAPDALRYLKSGGVFICSGIIDFRSEEVEAALTDAGFEIISKSREGEWVAVTARLP